jgi:hypothetical protein
MSNATFKDWPVAVELSPKAHELHRRNTRKDVVRVCVQRREDPQTNVSTEHFYYLVKLPDKLGTRRCNTWEEVESIIITRGL